MMTVGSEHRIHIDEIGDPIMLARGDQLLTTC